jgi:hypothetical protein
MQASHESAAAEERSDPAAAGGPTVKDQGDVQRVVNDILQDHRDGKLDRYSRKYPDFARAYPTLLAMCCNARSKPQKDTIRSIAGFMLAQLGDLNEGRLCGETASRAVADELNRRYVDPLLEKQPPNDGL